MSIKKLLTPKEIWKMLKSDKGLHIVSFTSSLIILIFTSYMSISIALKSFSKESIEAWDTFFLFVALVIYVLDTFGVVEKNPRAINIARSVTLISIAIPLLSRVLNDDFLIEHYMASLMSSLLLVILCYFWVVKHAFISINAMGEKTAKKEIEKLKAMAISDKS